jgi:hypothetical protein
VECGSGHGGFRVATLGRKAASTMSRFALIIATG